MNMRLILPLFLTFFCFSLLAQPKILSVSYDGNKATITRNSPPDGIVYYWQGSSCGTLMFHSGSTTVASSEGTFYLREFISTGAVWATTCVSTVVMFPDVTPPVLSGVTTGTIGQGDLIAATSNEAGMIYLVPDGTAATVGAIGTAKLAEAVATANVAVSLSTSGIALGNYVVYAVDGSDNVSIASAAITIADLRAPVLSAVTAGPIGAGTDIMATSNEPGMIYLVPDGTAANVGAIGTAKLAEATATANVAVSLSTSGLAFGDYVVYAVDGSDNVSSASAAITIADLSVPVLSGVTAGSIEAGTNIMATSNEAGMIYLVPDGTAASVGAIGTAKLAEATAAANVAVSLSTSGLAFGDYVVYAVDGSDNVSRASAAITIADLTAPILSGVTAGPIEVGTDIMATSNEAGVIYLVPNGTAANVGDIGTAKLAEAAATASVAVSLSTSGIALGDYVVYAVDGSDNVSTASVSITIADLTAPVLSSVTGGPIEVGDDILAICNEAGMIYLVPDGTAVVSVGDITTAQVAQVASEPSVAINLSTSGIEAGDYVVYAVDGSDNISAASSVITVNEVTYIDLNSASSGKVQIYPVNVIDILYIKSKLQVSSAKVYSLQGSQMMNLSGSIDQIDMSGLETGVYIVSIRLVDNTEFSTKVSKK